MGGSPFGAGYYGMWIGQPYPTTTIQSYTEGTLILDFVETRHGTLVFRGTSKTTVSGAIVEGDKIEAAVEKIVAKVPTTPRAPIVAKQ